jgi:hypothetical protein
MAYSYSKKEIKEMCEKASKDMKSFYKAGFVNYKGRTKKTEEKKYYSEIIAEWLLKRIDRFNTIREVERSASYNADHTGALGERTNRTEEYVAKLLFNSKTDYDGIGRIIDYQTPLKDPGGTENKGLGKIDLLSRNDTKKCVYILELKKGSSDETMLRCVLECYTYLRIISKEKLFEDFNIPSDYDLKAAPLVYKNSVQYKEYIDPNRNNLRVLMDTLNVTPFFLEEKPTFEITEP